MNVQKRHTCIPVVISQNTTCYTGNYRLCSWPTKLRLCIGSTKLAVKLEFLSYRGLIVGVRYWKAHDSRFLVARSMTMLLYMEKPTFDLEEITQL